MKAGEYLLTVNGREVHAPADVYSFLQRTAGKAVVLSVGPSPESGSARSVTVIPVAGEAALRNYACSEDNRRKVSELTDGRVGYLYLSDVTFGGYRDFNRYYFTQSGKDAFIVDERFNAGGWAPDYRVDYLGRSLLNYFHLREGRDITIPTMGISGPKVMIVNELSASRGDG